MLNIQLTMRAAKKTHSHSNGCQSDGQIQKRPVINQVIYECHRKCRIFSSFSKFKACALLPQPDDLMRSAGMDIDLAYAAMDAAYYQA